MGNHNDSNDPDLEALQRRVRDAERDVEDYERRHAQRQVEDMSPEERRKLIRAWTRSIITGGAAALVGAWFARHWRAATAVAFVAAVTVLATWWLWGTDDPRPQPEFARPPAETTTQTVVRTATAAITVSRTVTVSPSPAVERVAATRQATIAPPTPVEATTLQPPTASPTGQPSTPQPPTATPPPPPATTTVTATPPSDDDDDARDARICVTVRSTQPIVCVWPPRR